MRLSKRLFSILLTAALLCSAVSVLTPGVFAVSDPLDSVSVGSLIEFGSYPQTEVKDSATLSALNKKSLSWKSYVYYSGNGDYGSGKPSDYMKYADVTYNGNKYRAVKFTSYRPYWTQDPCSVDYSYQNDNGYSPDSVYWFKFEPIVWRVLDPSEGLVMTESIIDAQPFENDVFYYNGYYYGDENHEHYASDWKYSSLRKWLNGDYYNTAFSGIEKGYIRETNLTTPSSYSSGYDAGATKDKIFLLARGDALNESYGFSSSYYSGEDTNRVAFGTDYAKCQGLYVYNSSGYYYSGASYWRLRTPYYSDYTDGVYDDGHVDDGYGTNVTSNGVRAALYLNPQSLIKIYNDPGFPGNGTEKEITKGTLITFGSYPQSSVTDPELLSGLESRYKSWKYYDYYCSGKQEKYMKYADVTYSGEKYRAVKFTHYRPSVWTDGASAEYTRQDENGYEPDKIYWFRYDPIVWRVLDAKKGLLMTENLLDSQPFHNVYYRDYVGVYYTSDDYKFMTSDWKNVSLRSWMNNDFYDAAFTAEQSHIRSAKLKTPSSSPSMYNDYTTTDKVFPLTKDDVSNTAYGFSSGADPGKDTKRAARGTDYARCQGLLVYEPDRSDDEACLSDWRLRTPDEDNQTFFVKARGGVAAGAAADCAQIGVRPALYVDIESAVSDGLISVTDSSGLVINGPSGTAIASGDTVSDHIKYPTGRESSRRYSYKYHYSDGLFSGSSSEYNHDLATTSLAFEYAACAPDNYVEKDPPLAEAFFSKTGFNVFRSYGYDENKTFEDMNGVACIVGYKNITVDGNPATLVGCAIRGGGYMEEWGGNFNMGAGTQHEGFNIAADKVLMNINSFIGDNKDAFNKDVYFWVTGYSRAAAVANITAARLNKGVKAFETSSPPEKNYLEPLNTDKTKVFCYTFETPKCTTDKNAASSDYDNIFNMVNPNDPVPKVAPYYGDFRFTRYGQSYYFPARETTPGYGDLLKKYTEKYSEVCPDGYVYSEEFAFGAVSVAGGVIAASQYKKIGQMTFGNNLVKYITEEALKNRKNFVDKYQTALSTLIAVFAGGYHIEDNNKEALGEALLTDLLAYFGTVKALTLATFGAITPVIALKITDDLSDMIRKNLLKYTELEKEDIDGLLTQLEPLLAVAVRHLDYTITAVENIIRKAGHKNDKNGFPVIIYPHTDTVLTAWMAMLGDFTEAEFDRYVKNRSMQNDIKINCPVDVAVYDDNDQLVASVINDEVQDCGDNWLVCYIDDNGQKIITLPEDGKYRIEVTAREDCDVSVSSVTSDCDTVETVGVENYYSLDVKARETLEITADEISVTDDGIRAIGVKKDEEVIVASETVIDTEDMTHTVTVESDTGIVFGGGVCGKGEFAALRAVPEAGQKFEGWYVDGKLVSADAEYRFCVTEDVTVTGRFLSVVTFGDVNGDGDVLANDARLALRASAQLETLDEKQFAAADVNEDKKVLADDARQILRFSAKLVSEFKKAEN